MAIDFFTRWNSELFSGAEFPLMIPLWEKIVKTLDTDKEEIYFSTLRDYLLGWYNVNEFTKLISDILPHDALDDHHEMFVILMNACAMDDVSGSEKKEDESNKKRRQKADSTLPNAFNINALVMLNCLRKGFEFPDGDPGLLINNAVRNILKERIEGAVRVRKTHAVNDHGFIKYFGQKNTIAPTDSVTLTSRDFFDSLVLTDSINISRLEQQLEHSESHTNFFFKMMEDSFPKDEEASL